MSKFKEQDIKLVSKFIGENKEFDLNNSIRKNVISKEDKESIKQLAAFLEKCEPYADKYIYRNDPICDPEFYLIWYSKNINKIITRPEFLRASKGKINGYNLEIKTHKETNCRDLVPIIETINSKMAKDEKEVVFKRNTNFKITKVDSEAIVITLEETDEASEIVLTKKVIFQDADVISRLKSKRTIIESTSEQGLI